MGITKGRAIVLSASGALLLSPMAGCGAKGMQAPATTNTSPAPVLTPSTLNLAGQGGSMARIPPSYRQGTPNRWVLYLHGYNQSAETMLTGDYAAVSNALLASGYVLVSMTNTIQNCYGNPECSADVAAVTELYRHRLSLDPEPFVMADSMGGFTALNAIAAKAMKPRAVVGWCVNTNLLWDFQAGGAAQPITEDYRISQTLPYGTATAGSDPMLDGGAVFASVPFALWSSYGDTVVLRSENTDAFAAIIDAAGGQVAVHTSTGNHLDASNFDPVAVVAFFDAH